MSRNSAVAEPSWLRRAREITETLVDREFFEALPPLPTLRTNRPQANSKVAVTRMTLRDRKRPDTDVSVASGTRSPPKLRQTRTPPRTPQSSPPKPPQTSASRRKVVASGRPMTASSDGAQSEKPDPIPAHSSYHPAPSKENGVVHPTLRLPKTASEGPVFPIPVDVTAALPTAGSRPPLTIRIKLPPRANPPEAVKTDPPASVTNPPPALEYL